VHQTFEQIMKHVASSASLIVHSFGWIYLLLLLSINVEAWQPTHSQLPTCHRGTQGRLFLDTADSKVWDELMPLGIFHGITCNPTLLERAKQPCTVSNLHYLAKTAFSFSSLAGQPCCHEFMCQAWGSTAQEMFDIGMQLSQPDRDRIVIKVPVTTMGTQAAAMLIQANVRVCLTACYSSRQAIVAAGVGAEYLAPYLGRMNDNGKDGLQECQAMEEIVRGMGSSTRILVASIRSVDSMAQLMQSHKMDTFTFNPDVARELFSEPLTLTAAEEFEEAARRNQ